MTPAEAKLVETYCKPNFDTTFTLREQPAGLCSTCRWYLFACKRGQNWDEVRKPSPRSRWDAFEMEHGRFKESAHDPDVCQVCLLAKWNPVGEPERNADKRYIMKSIIEPVPAERSYKFCDKCYQHIGRGIPHPCTPASAKKNLANIVAQLPENSQGQVVSSCLKTLASTSRAEAGNVMKLNQLKGGNKLSVTVGQPKTAKSDPISFDFLASLQKKLQCSENKLLMLAREFRTQGVQFEPNIREDLAKLSHSLDEYFNVEKLEFICKNSDKVDVTADVDLVYVKDLDVFITHVISERELDAEKVLVRVGLDGGGGSFKVTASIFETKFHQNQTEAEENQEHGAGEAEEEEMMDQDGLPGLDQAEAAEDGEDYGTSGNKLTGSNKLLVFALGEGIDENYNNVRIVVEKLKLHELHCCFASDMKLINVLIGLSSHSARHACPYCEGEMTLEVGTLRTFGRLADWHNKLQQDAANSRNLATFIQRNQKNYTNVIHPSLLKGDPEQTILSTIPLPELHLLMGVVNWALVLLYKSVPNKEALQERMRSVSVSVHGYHGGGLDGNNSAEFLKHLDFIFENLPDELLPVKTMLLRFKQVVCSCFSMSLAPSFREDIDIFNQSVATLIDYSNNTLKIKLTPTWKIHVLVCHLKPFLEEKKCGLGVFCEQCSEAAHAVMKPTMQRFKRRSDHRHHGSKLKRGTTDYTAKNMTL